MHQGPTDSCPGRLPSAGCRCCQCMQGRQRAGSEEGHRSPGRGWVPYEQRGARRVSEEQCVEAWPPQRQRERDSALRAASWAHPQKVSCSGRSGACPGLCIFPNSTGDSRAGGLHPQSQSPVCFPPHRSILLILEAPRVCGQDLFPLPVSAHCFLDTLDGGEESEPGDPGSRSRKAGCVSLVGPRGPPGSRLPEALSSTFSLRGTALLPTGL